MDGREARVELLAAVEVDVLPAHRRNALGDLGSDQLAAELKLRQRLGPDQGV